MIKNSFSAEVFLYCRSFSEDFNFWLSPKTLSLFKDIIGPIQNALDPSIEQAPRVLEVFSPSNKKSYFFYIFRAEVNSIMLGLPENEIVRDRHGRKVWATYGVVISGTLVSQSFSQATHSRLQKIAFEKIQAIWEASPVISDSIDLDIELSSEKMQFQKVEKLSQNPTQLPPLIDQWWGVEKVLVIAILLFIVTILIIRKLAPN